MLFLIFTTAFSIHWRQDKLIELSTLALLINVQCTKYIQYHGKSGTSAQLTQSQAANFEWNEFLTSPTACMYPGPALPRCHAAVPLLQCCSGCDMSHTDTGAGCPAGQCSHHHPWDNGAQTSVQWTQSAAATIILQLETKVHTKAAATLIHCYLVLKRNLFQMLQIYIYWFVESWKWWTTLSYQW